MVLQTPVCPGGQEAGASSTSTSVSPVDQKAWRISIPLLSQVCYASTVMVAGGGSNEGPLSEEPIHSFVRSSCDMSSIPQAPQRQQWFNCFSRPAGAVQTQKEGRGLQAVNPRRAGAERHQSAVHSGHGGAAGTPLGRHRLCWEGSERL